MSQLESTPAQVTELAENTALLEQQRLLGEMLARSATDKEFRQLLLTDSRAAFAAFGAILPEGLDVRFVENKHDATIVLPDAIDAMQELSEDDLAQMNGGAAPILAASAAAVSNLTCFAVSAIISGSFALTAYVVSKTVE
jgi:hypothetical protein